MNAITKTSTSEEVIDFDLNLIIASKTNPRTIFDPVYLTEMAGTIKALGRVQQAILLRPLPASRMEETAHMKPRPTHEIVYGECRYRSSKIADMSTIKATVRNISDKEVLIIQLIENLKRRDLTELEEAEGYRRLMDETGQNADEVGKSIERSRAYIYSRIKLLDLGTEGRTALREKKIEASTALLIARIPDSKLQAKALQDILQGNGYDREPMSVRTAQHHVQDRYMLKLSSAKFNIKSVDLVAAAGACQVCPKRTGAAPELFEDVKSADVCTDPTCFHKKEAAHSAAQIAAAEAKGLTVIAGKEALELKPEGYGQYSDKVTGYRRLDSVDDSPTDQPLRKLIGALMKAEGIKPVLIESGRNKGEFLECLPNDVALKLLKMAEKAAIFAADVPAMKSGVNKEVQKLVDDKKAKAEAKAKAQYEREWRANLVADSWATMRDDAEIKAFQINVHRYLAVRAARNLSTDDAAAICKLLNLGKVSPASAVADFAKETVNPELLQLLIIMQESSDTEMHTYDGRIPNEGLLLVAGNVFGKQLDDVVKEIKAEVKAKIWPKVAKKAALPTASLAQPEHAGGDKPKGAKPTGKKAPAARAKLSAEEAKSGIAAAMQGMEQPATARADATSAKTQGALQPANAWPFQPKAKSKAPAQTTLPVGFAVGQQVLVTTDSDKFGSRLTMHKWLGKKGTITGRAGKAWDVTFKGRSGGVAAFDEDEISLVEEAVAA